MRAFASFPAAVFFVLAILVLASIQRLAAAESHSSSSQALFLEGKYYSDVSFKKAFSQVLRLSPGLGEVQSSKNIASNLALMQEFAKGHFARKGVQAEFWFGELGEAEERRLLAEMLLLKKPLRCSHCYALDSMTVDWEGKPVFKSVELIFDREVSRLGFVHTPSSAEWVGKEILFGASFYWREGGLAWVSAARAGFD